MEHPAHKNTPGKLVSIVVCTYNGAVHLAAQLESLLKQDYPNLEILICDDASTDDTLSIARQYEQRDARIHVHAHTKNLGYNQNFEWGFRKASGDYIAVCDQDDVWKENKISRLITLFSEPETLLVFCQSVRFTGEIPDITYLRNRNLFEGSDLRQLMYFNTVAGHNMLFKKELLSRLNRFPDDVFYDWWLLLSAAHYGKVKGTEEVLTFHRYHQSNLTLGKKDEGRQTRKKAQERMRTLNRLLAIPDLNPADRRFGEDLLKALEDLEGKQFSWKLFRFLLLHAATIFFFKKKSWFSKAKMAYKLSFAVE